MSAALALSEPLDGSVFDVGSTADAGQVEQIWTDESVFPVGDLGSKKKLKPSDQLQSKDLLALLLSFVCAGDEAEGLAGRLIDRFHSLGEVLSASPSQISGETTIGAHLSAFFQVVRLAMKVVLREPLRGKVLVRSYDLLEDYLRISLAHEQREETRLLLLDENGYLIKDELHSRGTRDSTPVSLRDVVRQMIEANATALILVHNHPSGDPKPSRDDVEMTEQARNLLWAMDMRLIDHVIVGRTHMQSMMRRWTSRR